MVRAQRQERGAALIEFSLSVLIFLVIVMGLIEFGRAVFLLNLAGRATQMATRMATVCDQSDPQYDIIREKVRYYVEASGQITVPNNSTWLSITPNMSSCYFANQTGQLDPCWVTTSLNGLKFNLMIPTMNIEVNLPQYRVTQVREAMSSANNPECLP